MINLIPPVKRRELQAMRHNTILVRYVLIALVFFVVTLIIHFGTFLLLRQAEVANTAQSESHLAKANEYEDIHRRAQDYTKNLAAAKALFEASIPYPEALSNLAKTLPAGVIIDTVNLEAGIIDQPGTLTAHAVSYDAAVALKDSFTNSPIATGVSIANVTNTAISGGSDSGDSSNGETGRAPSQYPIQVTLNITFTRELLYPAGQVPEEVTPEIPTGPDPAAAGATTRLKGPVTEESQPATDTQTEPSAPSSSGPSKPERETIE